MTLKKCWNKKYYFRLSSIVKNVHLYQKSHTHPEYEPKIIWQKKVISFIWNIFIDCPDFRPFNFGIICFWDCCKFLISHGQQYQITIDFGDGVYFSNETFWKSVLNDPKMTMVSQVKCIAYMIITTFDYRQLFTGHRSAFRKLLRYILLPFGNLEILWIYNL